jgi:hypothetical protein
MTLKVSNGGDDRGRAQRPASHRSNDPDDADEAVVTRGYTPQGDEFSASFGVTNPNEDHEY